MAAEPFLKPGVAWLVLTAFSVLWVALGIWWGRRGAGDADDYLLAGRNVGLSLSTATLMASWVTGNTTMTAPEAGYTLGVWGMIGYSLAGMGLVLFAPLAVRIKKLMPKSRTSGDFVRLRYGKLAWLVFLLITIAYTLVFLITQGMGAGLLLQALAGFDYRVGMVVVIGVATAYTLFGGLRAVIGTDFMQSLLIMVLLVLVAVLGFSRFGTADIYTDLAANHPSRLDLLLPAGLLFAWNTGLFSMGEVFHNNIWWSRVFASRPSVVFPSFVMGGSGLGDGAPGDRFHCPDGPGQGVSDPPGEHGLSHRHGHPAGRWRGPGGVRDHLCLPHLHPGFPSGGQRRSAGRGRLPPHAPSPGHRSAAAPGRSNHGDPAGRRHHGALLEQFHLHAPASAAHRALWWPPPSGPSPWASTGRAPAAAAPSPPCWPAPSQGWRPTGGSPPTAPPSFLPPSPR